MFDIQHYGSFIGAILVFQVIPGPGTLAILNATARGGLRAGMGAVLGTLAGDFLYMSAAVLGLAAVLAAYPVAFQALRWFGIAYLLWMGWGLLRARADGQAEAQGESANGWLHFRRAFAVSLTNPKVVMFFMAFFPLFLRADAHPATLGLMMAHVTILSLAYQAGLVVVGNAVAKRLARIPAARALATRLAGIALVGFGLRLALDGK
jgi:threonine/homoserine/homoserine lactone efflux protein